MIFHQPYEQALGSSVIDNLSGSNYNTFKFIVAYSKTSGVNRLLPYMKLFKEKKGFIEGVVGIDQYNTSYEALKSLVSVCNKLYVFHSENSMQTFHPKMYYFSNKDTCWFSVGSNNMTAGGLFSNYELSYSKTCDITNEDYRILDKTYNSYSDTQSPCCNEVTEEFINILFENNYIKKEKDLAKERLSSIRSKNKTSKNSLLFGNETFIAPTIKSRSTGSNTTAISHPDSTAEICEQDYLIRHVPKAGDRSKQVHFNLDILNNYFKLKPGDALNIQELTDIYTPKNIEHRTIVYSTRNKNVKIEIEGAQILDTHYPTDNTQRPILIIKRINPSLFEYMLLMNGNQGYTELNTHLLSLPVGKSLAYQIISEENLLSLWDECPLV